MNMLFSDSSKPSDDDMKNLCQVLFNDDLSDDDDGSLTSEISDRFFGHQTVDYMVQFLYNFLVVAHRLYMDNTHIIELDVLTSLIISPHTGLFYKNSKNETIQIGLKMLVMSDAIERPGIFVSFYGVERIIKKTANIQGKCCCKMLMIL